MINSLKNRLINIIANDFIPQNTPANILLIDETTGKMLLTFDPALKISGVLYEHAVASARLSKNNPDDLLRSGLMGCSITWVSIEKFNPEQPLDLSWWRGGAAAVADICLR